MDTANKKQKTEPNARVYHRPWSSSSRVATIIYDLGIEDQVAIETLAEFEDRKKDWYLKLHPQGKIPVYTEGDKANPDFVLTESVAIALYLLEKYDTEGRLLPKTDLKQRARVFQFASFASSEAYRVVCEVFNHSDHNPHVKAEDKNPKVFEQQSKIWSESHVKFIVANLGDKKFLLGENPTAADLLLAYDLLGAQYFNLPLDDPILAAYLGRLVTIESVKKTYGM